MKFETLLYLFFIILTIIVPLFRKKKNVPAKSPAGQPPREDDFFKSLEKKLNEWAEQAPVEEFPAEEEIVEETIVPTEKAPVYENYEAKIDAYDNQPAEIFSYDNQYNTDKVSMIESSMLADHKSAEEAAYAKHQEEGEHVHFRFNAIEAVIYSEILKRPEY